MWCVGKRNHEVDEFRWFHVEYTVGLVRTVVSGGGGGVDGIGGGSFEGEWESLVIIC
ncbi:hypothetical protein HanRHA438_Chr07g0325981 [Helianthus annuus]|nr:hypothetical protein HanIR_Chr07g0340911 [Helianthus annuus]KAJ0909849.1 hypothetical protein HanRHA438_Chr07g0325981 [Helianthus annuus]